MANPGRPRVIRATSGSTFYQIRGPESSNSNSSSLGVIYPVFFLASITIAIILYITRERTRNDASPSGIGLFLKPEPLSDISNIQNLTNQVDAMASGLYRPQ